MKYLEDLRDRHKGEEIWAVGAGSGLDNYPIDFFEDKICIGVNRVFSVFLDVGDGVEKFGTRVFYSVHSHRQAADWIARHIPHFLMNCFLIYHPPSSGGSQPYCRPQDFNDTPYWIRNSFGVQAVKASDADFVAMAKCIMERRDSCRYVCRGTTLHWAIEVAVVLGAKRIYVVGDAGAGRMRKHGSRYKQSRKRKRLHPHWRKGTKALAAAFRPYKVEIVRHCYGKGEQKL